MTEIPSFSLEYTFSYSYDLLTRVPFKSTNVIFFGNPGFGVLKSLPFLPPKWISSKVEDLCSEWTNQMNSNSIAFGSSCSTHPFFSHSDFLRNGRYFVMRPPQINDSSLLWDFILSTKTRSMVFILLCNQGSRSSLGICASGVSTFNLLFSPKYFHTWSSRSRVTCPPQINVSL
jgi:hypothetical protein